MANQPIPVAKATAMMQQYVAYMTDLGVDMSQQTQVVSFNANDLKHWIDDVMPYTDEFRICMCVYPATDADAGRSTVAIWPYKDGSPARTDSGKGVMPTEIEPYNAGGLIP